MGHPTLVAPKNAESLCPKPGLPLVIPPIPAFGGACRGRRRLCLRQVEKEMTLQKPRWMRGPEGRSPKLQPSPEGLGEDRQDCGALEARHQTRACTGKRTLGAPFKPCFWA